MDRDKGKDGYKIARANKMFLQWCRDDLVLSFIFVQRYRFMGQDAASDWHHCTSTNVGNNWFFPKPTNFQSTKKQFGFFLCDCSQHGDELCSVNNGEKEIQIDRMENCFPWTV